MVRVTRGVACGLLSLLTAVAASAVQAEERPPAVPTEEVVSTVDPAMPRGVCSETAGRLPPTVVVDSRLTGHVRRMLERSPEFRRQCEALAELKHVYVRVSLVLHGLPPGVHAQSQVTRTNDGPLFARVQVSLTANWSEWIGHEFEHVLEQAEGMTLTDYRTGDGRWESVPDAYETTRAIAAGRAIRNQVLHRTDAAHD